MIQTNELGWVVNDQGQVAMRFMQQKPALVTCNQTEYYFATRANISLAWVDADDVDCLLGVRMGCNCGGGTKKKNVIFLADQLHTNRWLNGGGS